MTAALDPDIETLRNKTLFFAHQLMNHLKIPALPKDLIDDRKRNIDPDTRSEDDLVLDHFNEDSLFSIKTVRFLKDFSRYNCVPDLETRNESFKRTAELFRQQGIVNCYFILQLNNPMLKGVDPYDENLSDAQRTWVMNECRENFWYFLREVCKLKPDRQFLANRGNISFIWTYLNHITTYMIMPRQQGKLQRNSSKVRIVHKGVSNTPESRWTTIGKVRVGDEIIDRYGQPTTVIGVHPQGNKRLYRVKCSDGRYTDAGAEHLWHICDYTETVNGHGIWDEFTTAQLLAKLNSKTKLELPLIDPEDGIRSQLIIDPYIMGVLMTSQRIGDGLLCPFISEDGDSFMEANLPESLKWVKDGKKRRLIKAVEGGLSIDPVHGLPQEYLEGALEDRMAVIQAFLDQSNPTPEGFVFSPKNPLIGNQLQYLVRGVGGTAKRVNGKIVVTLPDRVRPFRHKDVVEDLFPENRLYIESIEYTGHDECTCIEVDNEEHLYITDDFIVTHNTVSVQVIKFWLTFITGRGYKSHLLTLKSDNRAQFIDAIKKIRSCLPNYMINTSYMDKDAGTSLTYKAFGDEYVNSLNINVPQMGEDAAGDMGRGLTVGTTNVDEPAYIKHIEAIINGCMPSALTEMELCRDAGKPYGINYITTPNTTLHPSGKFMFKKLMTSTEWREKFFDSFSESHLKDRLLKASPRETTSPSVAMVYSYLQLGKDKNWVKETIDSLSLSLAKAKIDLLLMWVEDGENRLFDDQTREAINNVKREVVWSKEYVHTGLHVDFFVTQEKLLEMGKKEYGDFFLIGVDTSSAINKDACTLIIRSMRTGKVIGVGRYKLTFLDHVTDVIVDMLSVIQNSLLVIERNYAHHMIDSLLITLPAKGMDPFTRIFNQVYQNPVQHSKEFELVQSVKFQHRSQDFYLKFKQFFGFNTTANSRKILYGLIQEAVGVTGYGLSYDKLADELINLKIRNDRIDHEADQHDDLVISWLLTYWFIKLGMNKPYYNIPSGIALTDVRNLLAVGAQKEEPKVDPSVLSWLTEIKKRIQVLTDEFLNTRDNLLAMRLEAEIMKLGKLLPPDQQLLRTMDSLLEDARMERNKKIMQLRRAA